MADEVLRDTASASPTVTSFEKRFLSPRWSVTQSMAQCLHTNRTLNEHGGLSTSELSRKA